MYVQALEAQLHGFTFRFNARAVICGQTSHQLTPIFRITAQGGFSENSGMCREHHSMYSVHVQ